MRAKRGQTLEDLFKTIYTIGPGILGLETSELA